MISLQEAINKTLNSVKTLDTVSCSLSDAYGKVLAQDIFSDMDMPPFDKSAMDGYAVKAGNVENRVLKIQDEIPAGVTSKIEIFSGTCAKIMTGAPIPKGADAVVKIEDTTLITPDTVRIEKSAAHGGNICKKAEDIRKGDIVIKAGTLIQAPEIAVLASVGMTSLQVYRIPSVAVICTGNEITEPDEMLKEGAIRNSNGQMLVSLVRSFGFTVDYLGIAKDNKNTLSDMIEKGLSYDMILLTGGVSMGAYDFVPEALKSCNVDIFFHHVAVKPGKPLIVGEKDAVLVFGIPGNPVSNFTTFNIFVKPALFKMMGKDYDHVWIEAEITDDLKKKRDRVHIIPGVYDIGDGKYKVTPLSINGSADIIGCVGCNCFILVEKETAHVKAGENVRIIFS